MTTEAPPAPFVHPNISATMAEFEAELLKWVDTPGTVHVTCVIELRNGVPRQTIAIGGTRKNNPI